MHREVKNLFAIILPFLIAFPLMLKVFVFTSWQINQDYIAQTSCENRYDPTSDCAGSCQLVKQLNKTEPQEKPFTPPVGIEKVELSNFTSVTTNNNVSKTEDSSIIHYTFNDKLAKSNIAYSFFHPPEPLV